MENKGGIRQYNRFCIGLLALASLAGCGRGGGPSVQALSQTIRFGAVPALFFPGTATVTATASSGLTVSYSSTTPAICSVDSAGLVTSIAAGTCTIAADQAGNSAYAPAPQATQSIPVTVNPVQTISFGAAPSMSIYGIGVVSATATSGLAVSYSSLAPAVCTVDAAGVVTSVTAGNCTIAADQAGNSLYNPAPQATQTIVVPAWTGPQTVPGAPASVSATMGTLFNTVAVSFVGPTSSGGSPISGYTVVSNPVGLTASGTALPITVSCPVTCNGYAFSVYATNALGNGAQAAWVNVLTNYNVVATFIEPATQPNNSVFTGSFTLDSTVGAVSNLKGSLTQSMTGQPMTTVALKYQLSSVSDGAGGLLVTTFALNTINTFAEGGFVPGSPGLYYGFPSAPNPAAGGVGNAYTMIYVNPAYPLVALTSAQIGKLAYADCTALGMMGDTCMTGYVGIGTMGGFPAAQVITRQ